MLSIHGTIGYSTPIVELHKEFQPGKIYGISGNNGVGKTTLLRTLAGEIFPLSGIAHIDNMPVTNPQATGRIIHIATPEFYPDVSIGEHLNILHKVNHVDYTTATRLWQLTSILEKSPNRVSSGQQQRTFLAAQLTLPADVVTLDEPERHLDATWVQTLCDQLQEKATHGTTIIIATHSHTLLHICDEIVQLAS